MNWDIEKNPPMVVLYEEKKVHRWFRTPRTERVVLDRMPVVGVTGDLQDDGSIVTVVHCTHGRRLVIAGPLEDHQQPVLS